MPTPPIRVSAPVFPSRMFAALLPVITLLAVLPVPLIAAVPVRVRFSRLVRVARLKVTED